MRSRVPVITGIGVISSIGNTPEQAAESLRLGRSGVVADPRRVELGFASPLTGMVRGFDPSAHLGRKQRKTMPDFAVQAYAAARQALDMAGLPDHLLASPDTGLVFGSDSSCLAAAEQATRIHKEKDTSRLGSGLIFRSMNSTITMNLNTIFGTRGACWTLSSACSSSGHAIGQAADLVALGRQKRVLCGGAQEINPESVCSFDGLGAFSTRTDDPAGASRPFDKDRDGLVPSGGAAALLIESEEEAVRRGAPVLGRVSGYAFSSDGAHISAPSLDGVARAMRGALADAGMAPEEVDYVCAHATSTPVGDRVEALALAEVFGEHKPLVSSTKSLTGHELWMSGAAQAAYAVLMRAHGFIAGNANFTAPDRDTAGLNILASTLDRPPRNALLNAMGFGGTNSCLVLEF